MATSVLSGPKTNVESQSKISVAGLNFFYGIRQTLYDISIEIPPKKITAFIGPSGCGKTTFLRTLNRMHETLPNTSAQGQLLLDGTDILAMDVAQLRRRVGMVFQRPNPFPKTIYENVAYGVTINGSAAGRKVDEIVEMSLHRAALWNDVKDRLNKSAFSLSGGQQQRLCIARALAIDPEVILFDEPCSALDPISTAKIEELLFQLKEQCTIVLVTHNMQQAARSSDYTGFFLLGKLVEFNATNVIFHTPFRKETEDYITGRFG